MNKPQIITTGTGDNLVGPTERGYDAMRACAGDQKAEDAVTARIVNEAKEAGGAALPLAIWDEIEAAPSPIGPLRKWRRLTQEALANKAGISQGYLSEFEAGRKTGDGSTLRRIAKALGVSLDDLVYDEES